MHPDELLKHVGTLKTRMGAAFVGERAVFRGHDLHADLHDMDWVELYTFGITGRRFTPNELELLHAIWVYTSYPDARIWNNRVAALAGSSRSTGALGLSGALAVSEASIYGGGIIARSIQFLINTRKRLHAGDELINCIRDEFEIHRSIAGYGRPLRSGDERIKPMMKLVNKLGRDQLPYLKLAFAIEEVLLQGRWRQRMNFGALSAALGADLGFGVEEHYLAMFPIFLAGMPPCYAESRETEAGPRFYICCKNIKYEGKHARTWR